MELRKIFEILMRRKWWVIQSIVVIMGLNVALAWFMTPIYKSTSLMLIEPRSQGSQAASLQSLIGGVLGDMVASEGMVYNEMQVVKSPLVRGRTARDLDLREDDGRPMEAVPSEGPFLITYGPFYGMEVEQVVRRGSVVKLSAYGPSAELAKKMGDALVKIYREERQGHMREGISSALKFLEGQLPKSREDFVQTASALRAYLEKEGFVNLPQETQVIVQKMADLYQELLEDKVHFVAAQSIEQTLLKQQQELRHAVAEPQDVINPLMNDLLQRLSSARSDIDAIRTRQAAINLAIKEYQDQLKTIPAKAMQMAQLELANRVAMEGYEALLTQQLQAQIMEAMQVSEVWVIGQPTLPLRPTRPDWLLTIVLGLFVSGCFGAGLALTVEYVDDRLRSSEEVEEGVGAAVGAVIPYIRSGGNRLLGKDENAYAAQEAYRRLIFNLNLANVDKPIRTVLVASSGPSEGKSLTSSNMAICEVLSGKKVVLMDMDLLRPALAALFGIRQSPGVTEWITGKASFAEATQEITFEEGQTLYVMPSGIVPANRMSIIASDKFRNMVLSLKDRFDVIVMDAPPVLPVDDARVIAPMVDALVMVCALGQTHRRALAAAARMLKREGYPPVLYMANKYRHRLAGYDTYYYGYHHYYGEGAGKKRSWLKRWLKRRKR